MWLGVGLGESEDGLRDFRLSQHERFDVLAFQAHAVHGEESLEIIFPTDHEKALSEIMKQVFAHGGEAT
jgi:hypothetical protein